MYVILNKGTFKFFGS